LRTAVAEHGVPRSVGMCLPRSRNPPLTLSRPMETEANADAARSPSASMAMPLPVSGESYSDSTGACSGGSVPRCRQEHFLATSERVTVTGCDLAGRHRTHRGVHSSAGMRRAVPW
jgi:hypothetical protein